MGAEAPFFVCDGGTFTCQGGGPETLWGCCSHSGELGCFLSHLSESVDSFKYILRYVLGEEKSHTKLQLDFCWYLITLLTMRVFLYLEISYECRLLGKNRKVEVSRLTIQGPLYEDKSSHTKPHKLLTLFY
jgi:hypothetical protein